VDETSFPRANRQHTTICATGLIDLQGKVLIDMVEAMRPLTYGDGRRAPIEWVGGITVMATT
jgi:hypothetical protein